MKLILIPAFSGMYDGLYASVRTYAPKDSRILVDVNRALSLIRKTEIEQCTIIMGGKIRGRIISAKQAYDALKDKVKLVVADGMDWGIPGQHFLPQTQLKTLLNG